MPEPPRGSEGNQGPPPNRPGRGPAPRGPRHPEAGPKGGQGRPGGRGDGPGPGRRPASKPSPIGLARIGGNNFELVHPRGVRQMEPDYEEGMELWKAGDPESARDALRYALSECGDNLWIHTALGRIALEEFHDPSLAHGHFGYTVQLVRKALPPQFAGRLPAHRPNNRPFFEAIDGLLQCLEALGQHDDCRNLRSFRDQLSGDVVEGLRRRAWESGSESAGIRRRYSPDFFDFRDFSALQGSPDRDRTTADRDPRGQGMDRHSRRLFRGLGAGSGGSMVTSPEGELSVIFAIRFPGSRWCPPGSLRLEARTS